MADRPILFSGPMVRAILEGRKTQTRRMLNNSSLLFNGAGWPKGLNFSDMRLYKAWVDGGPSPAGNPGPYLKADWPYGKLIEGDDRADAEWLMARLYPKMQPGDRLWVKETWYCDHTDCQRGPYLLPQGFSLDELIDDGFMHYRATHDGNIWEAGQPKWRTPLHLPRWASRLTLTVTDVRVERLQDISEADAAAEGLFFEQPTEADREWAKVYAEENGGSPEISAVWTIPGTDCGFGPRPRVPLWGPTPKSAFQSLWDSINGKREGARWDDNPWVAAYTFTVEQRNIDA